MIPAKDGQFSQAKVGQGHWFFHKAKIQLFNSNRHANKKRYKCDVQRVSKNEF
jgi:hypothetical protein